MKFELQSEFDPAWDQPKAIDGIIEWFDEWEKSITLLGATGTGKTFTMANVIQHYQKPTLVISHNKTLAAQLATEFKHFFPKNAVHYFVSYFDYYQPEAYLPSRDTYIEKEATVNQEIEMYRLAAMASLISREDVIVVASASALYGLGQKDFFEAHSLIVETGNEYNHRDLKKKLISMRYEPVQSKIEPGMFEFKGETCDIYSSTDKVLYRLHFNEDKLEQIQVKDMFSFKDKWMKDKIRVWPASQYLQSHDDVEDILQSMNQEMEARVSDLEKEGKVLEAHRLKKRTWYDIRMIRETWFTNWIENYSPYFDKRHPWEAPYTIFDYFPEDFMLIIDESHMSIPQLNAMPKADRARKINLVRHGFRLPSAVDHRPLRYNELEAIMWWKSVDSLYKDQSVNTSGKKLTKKQKDDIERNKKYDKEVNDFLHYRNELEEYRGQTPQSHHRTSVEWKLKWKPMTLFVSATPSKYELELCDRVVEQIIRPTGLLDPITSVYPKSGDYELLINSVDSLLKKKPYLSPYFNNPIWGEEPASVPVVEEKED